jgi:hypothetical protein
VNTVKAMREGRVRFFLGLGGNFLSAAPGTELTASALKSCELTTHISQSSTGRSEIDRQAQGPQICDSRGYHEHRKPL